MMRRLLTTSAATVYVRQQGSIVRCYRALPHPLLRSVLSRQCLYLTSCPSTVRLCKFPPFEQSRHHSHGSVFRGEPIGSQQIENEIRELEEGGLAHISLHQLALYYSSLCTSVSSELLDDVDSGNLSSTLSLMNSHLRHTLVTQCITLEDHKHIAEILGTVATLVTADRNKFKVVDNHLVRALQIVSEYVHTSVYGTPPPVEQSSSTSAPYSYVNILDDDLPSAVAHTATFSAPVLAGTDVVRLLQELHRVVLPLRYGGDAEQEVLQLLAKLSDRLRQSDCALSPTEVASALSTLHNKTSDSREVRMVFGAVIAHIHLHVSSSPPAAGPPELPPPPSPQEWTPELIQACMTSLLSMTDANNVILKGVAKFARLIDACDESVWSCEEVFQCMRGLRAMPADTKEVKAVLSALDKKLRGLLATTSNVSFGGISVGMSGLQSMTSKSNEVKQLLLTLALCLKKVEFVALAPGDTQDLAGQLGTCLGGLRAMNVHHAEVYSLVELLATRFGTGATGCPSGGEAGFSHPPTLIRLIRSLSNYSSDYEATTRLLGSITDQYIRDCAAAAAAGDSGGRLTSHDLLRLLFGLKNCSNADREVDRCVRAIVDSVSPPPAASAAETRPDRAVAFSAYDWSNALIGLRGMSGAAATSTSAGAGAGGRTSGGAVDRLLLLLAEELRGLQAQDLEEGGGGSGGHVLTARHVGVGLQGLQAMTCPPRPAAAAGAAGAAGHDPLAVVVLIDSLVAALEHQQLYRPEAVDPSSDKLAVIHDMTLPECARALYGLLHIHHSASEKILTLKANLLGRVAGELVAKYGSERQTHKRDISTMSELLELQRVLNFYSFVYRDDILCASRTASAADAGAARAAGAASAGGGGAGGAASAGAAGAARAAGGGGGGDGGGGGGYGDGDAFCKRVARVSSWINDFVKKSSVIVKPTDTSDNSVLERRFRSAIAASPRLTSPPTSRHEPQVDVVLNSNSNVRGFEVDIIATFTCRSGPRAGEKFIYNLEIDGPHHNKPHKERFFQLRDELLTQSGYVTRVRRVSLFDEDPRRMKVINRNKREAVVKKELQLMFDSMTAFFQR